MQLIHHRLQRLREERALDVGRELSLVEVGQPLQQRPRLGAHVVSLRAFDAVSTAVRTAQRLVHPVSSSSSIHPHLQRHHHQQQIQPAASVQFGSSAARAG